MSLPRIVVVGLGYVGLPLAVALARNLKSSSSIVTSGASTIFGGD